FLFCRYNLSILTGKKQGRDTFLYKEPKLAVRMSRNDNVAGGIVWYSGVVFAVSRQWLSVGG
ncbi:MAG: hypothetical protein AAFY15_10270, partial [Cyanobacteria bacterium J06648_11]